MRVSRRLLLSLGALAALSTNAKTTTKNSTTATRESSGSSDSSSSTCEPGDPVTVVQNGTTSALVIDSNCLSVVIPVVNGSLTIGGFRVQRVVSVPPITSLDLTNNELTSLPDLSEYASITKLKLYNNYISSMKNVVLPSTLEELDISSNPISSSLDLSEAPITTLTMMNVSATSDFSKISFPSTLQELVVSYNSISKFPASSALGSLKKLKLGTNLITSFTDLVVPSSVVELDLSWNKIASFNGFNLPSSVTRLYLGGNDFPTLSDFKTSNALTLLYLHDLPITSVKGVTLPSTVSALSFLNCNLTDLNGFTIPPSMTFMDISENKLTSLPSTWPDTIKSVSLIDNMLTELSSVALPASVTTLNFTGNQITEVYGVAFPLMLEKLVFDSTPISVFEIRRSDLDLIQNLKTFTATITQTSCSNAAAQAVAMKKKTVCVIPDEVFQKQYNLKKSSTKSATESKSSAGWVLPVVIVAAVIVVIAVSVFIFRRRRAQRGHEKGMPNDYAQTLANPSVFGELPEFSHPKGPHSQQQHTMMTLANMNSYSTMFSNNSQGDTSGSNGSNGPETSLIKYRIPTHEISLQRPIAQGGFGAVYLASYQMQDVVVKKILPEKANDDRCLQAFLDEIKLCATLNHPKIVRFIGVSWNTLSDIAVILEYMPSGDLDTLLKQQHARNKTHPDEFGWYESLNLPCKTAIALDVLDAIVYLHSFSSPIIHRDLKAKNVLLSQTYEAKLSDFGVSKEWNVDATMTAGIGTMAWIAPEVLRGERYTEKADIYSFGVILTELATCAKPFEGITNALIVLKVTSGEQRPDLGPNCPDDIKELGLRCLSYNPSDRPSAMVAHYELKTLLKAHTKFEL